MEKRQYFEEEDIENILAKCCFCRPPRSTRTPKEARITLDGEADQLIIVPDARTGVFDTLFQLKEDKENIDVGDYQDTPTLPKLILGCISKCPIDCRLELAHKMLTIGGISEVPGYCETLHQYIQIEIEKCTHQPLFTL